ncbi:BLOC-3 complex member HPS1-like [Babylonia areolata]|uniref:BLOC-3 complex member HPS1-like n=1 Tax=Babylonia areolata TaxID=304850 RepID=UPI003FD0BE48
MKCFLVVNQLNNPVFVDFDADFTKFIHKKAVELGLQNADEASDGDEIDIAVVTQLFSPLVLSQVPLDDQVQNPCTSIVCPGGLLLVFRKVDDIQYMAISGDEEDSVDFLQKKILVFMRMTKFLFGPVYMEISNCSASERAARWGFLRSILHTWTHLATTDHTFLVEASELLHVNQMVSEKCVSLLEKTVNGLQSRADQPIQHAFLLVNTKLLALYSRRSAVKLQPADILLTTLLTQDMFPCRAPLDDLLTSTPSFPAPPPHTYPSSLHQSTMDHHQPHSQPQDTDGALSGTQKDDMGGALSGTQRDDMGGVLSGTQRDDRVGALSGTQAESAGKDRDKTSDDNEEFHSAPTTPSPRMPTPTTDSDVGSQLQSGGAGRGPDREDADAHRHLVAGDMDGGLERLIPALSPSRTGSVASGNRTSSVGSSMVYMDYPPLSYSPHHPPHSPLLSGKLSALDGQRSDSSTATHSNPSPQASSDQPWVRGEEGGGRGPQSRSYTEHSGQAGGGVGGSAGGGAGGREFWPHVVFLQTPTCPHTPHTLHCAQVLPNISLVVVSQVWGQQASDPLCQILSIVQDLLQGRRNKLTRPQGQHVHHVITELLRKVHSMAKKFKRRIQNSITDILCRWENPEMREKLVTYLLQDEDMPMLPDLESPLMDLQRRLKELFQLLFVAPGRRGKGEAEGGGEGGREVMSSMKAGLQRELMDYRDYLGVKAQRNITMTSYLDEFPGLVHFIYVDRQFHQMIAPSFSLLSDTGNNNATHFLKDKIWTLYSYMMKKLQQGYTSVLLREGDFYFSFFLWFEDSSGNPMSVQEPYKPGLDTPLPGTLTGNFYKRLIRQCFPGRVEGVVHCYEMFLMHVGLVTPPYIAAHCQRLAHKLWLMSGEAYTPVTLL